VETSAGLSDGAMSKPGSGTQLCGVSVVTAAGRCGRSLDRSIAIVTISPDATWLATIGRDGMARTWDVDTGQRQTEPTGHAGWIKRLAVAPDGTRPATVGGGSVRTWDAVVGAAQPLSAGGRIDTHEIIYAPDGSRSVPWAKTGSVRIHDVATGEPCAETARSRGPTRSPRRAGQPVARHRGRLRIGEDLGPGHWQGPCTDGGIRPAGRSISRSRRMATKSRPGRPPAASTCGAFAPARSLSGTQPGRLPRFGRPAIRGTGFHRPTALGSPPRAAGHPRLVRGCLGSRGGHAGGPRRLVMHLDTLR
jgi:hypothetical protein